nr:MAG TPA: hypothetical protein [Bacteriophage sp.]
MEQITIVLNDMEDVKREIDNCQRKAVKSVVGLDDGTDNNSIK